MKFDLGEKFVLGVCAFALLWFGAQALRAIPW